VPNFFVNLYTVKGFPELPLEHIHEYNVLYTPAQEISIKFQANTAL